MKTVLVLVEIIILVSIGEGFSPRLNVTLGELEGSVAETVNGRKYFAFEGIPYARPPVGKRRFQEPKPPKPWIGLWHAKTMFKCMQYDHFTPPGQDMVAGDEDCLYVNVYTPDLNPPKKLDVLVFIHGGAFMFNYGGLYGPQILLDRDIVYINFNYRLGPLGFLSTEDDVIPGNNGMKDQILALKWIKDNVKYFGGNPNSITIMGMSAGGASVQMHYLLPQSKGLFHKGISQSGTVLNAWVLMENPLEKTKKLSSLIGCPTEDSKSMVDCLRHKPARQITHTVKHFQPWLYNPFSPFGLVVDRWSSDPLLPQHPYKLLKTKKVTDLPWITSYTSAEGLYPVSDFHHDHHLEYLNRNWNEILPHILHYNDAVDEELQDSVSEKIREYFFKEKSLTKGTFSSLVELVSDRLFVYDIEKASKLHSAAIKSPVYSYFFNYRGAHSKSEFRADSDKDIGVSHGDDTSYLLKTAMDVLSTEDDRKMSEMMITIVTSFMKNGVPKAKNITWESLSKNPSDPWNQLHIENSQNIFMEQKEELGNRQFWETLPFQENDRLFSTKDEL